MGMLASTETSVLLIIIAVPIALLSIAWQFSRGSDMLEYWAKEHGFKLLEKEYCWFAKGPFFWTSSKNQSVYRITVTDAEGQTRRGWARCGGWFFGMSTRAVEVRWDTKQQPSPPEPRGFPVIMPDADHSEDRRPL